MQSIGNHHQIPNFSQELSMNQSIENHDQTPKFSEEEKNGERLDLHSLHEKYVSYGFGPRRKYHHYFSDFPGMFEEDVIPPQFKVTPQYKEYLQAILDYLVSFLNRVGMNTHNVDQVQWVGRDPFLKILRVELKADEWLGLDTYLEDIDEDFELHWPNWPKSNPQIDKDTGLLEAKVVMLSRLLYETRFQTSQQLFWERTKNDVYI